VEAAQRTLKVEAFNSWSAKAHHRARIMSVACFVIAPPGTGDLRCKGSGAASVLAWSPPQPQDFVAPTMARRSGALVKATWIGAGC